MSAIMHDRSSIVKGKTWEFSGVSHKNRPRLKTAYKRRILAPITVCIGCLCKQRERPGAIVLGFDRRMTYVSGPTVTGKHDLTSKLFVLPLSFLGVVAGSFSQCERFISFLTDYMHKLKDINPVELEHIYKAVTDANHQIRLTMFEDELVSQLGMTRVEWLDRFPKNSKLRRFGHALANKVDPDVYCVVAGFVHSGPVLIRICGKKMAEEMASHTAIGSGAALALNRLAFRTQGPYCSIQRTALSVSEALRHSRRNKYVGPPAHSLVLTPSSVLQFNPNAKLLRDWSKNVKKSETDKLDLDVHWKEFEALLTPVSSAP
jgi:hypothetical protein